MQMTAGASVECLVVQRRAQQLGIPDAPCVGPHIDGCDWTSSGVEPEKSMPKCRDADRTSFLGGPIRVDGVEARADPLEQSRRVVLNPAVRCQGWRALHLVRTPNDRPARAVVERGADRRGPDVERDDHGVKIAPMPESWEVLTLRGLAA